MKKLLHCGLMLGMLTTYAYGQNLGFDRPVGNNLQQTLSTPDMTIAFNGWIYNAYRSAESIQVKVSKDHGKSWQSFTSLSADGYTYDAPSIVVTGTEENQLHLFVAGISKAKIKGQNTIFVNQYNAATGILINEVFSETRTGIIYACDLAGSIASSGKDQGLSSLSLLYAFATPQGSSLVQKTSVDEGYSFPVSNTVAQSKDYFRNVSISYGKSTSASNGRYFMAWDEYTTPTALWGKVYTSRNVATVTSATLVPQRIDDRYPETKGRLRYPVIAASTTTDNDSSSCTAVLLAEFDQNGDGSAIAISGFSNQRPHFTNYWNRMAIAETGTQPALAFDAANHTFAASYYNEKDKSMRLIKTDYRLPQAGRWKTVAVNYADAPLLSDPRPCIAIDPIYHQAALSWASSVSGHMISFDAEYNNAPGTLQEIGAQNKGRTNEVSWTAGATEDKGTITIERSADGQTFIPLATVAQQGNPVTNSYEDKRPEPGMNYYRIRFNATQHSRTVSAYADQELQKAWGFYPNPATDRLYITTPQPQAGATIIVYDIKGKTCQTVPVEAALTTMDISSLPAGIYMAQYDNGPDHNLIKFTKAAR